MAQQESPVIARRRHRYHAHNATANPKKKPDGIAVRLGQSWC